MDEPGDLPRIKQFGLQRSGTNVIKWLMERHYFVWIDVNRNGWKHGFVGEASQSIDLILISKNVFAWLDSIFRYSHPVTAADDPGIFSRFLRSPYIFENADAPNPVAQWNLMNGHWHSLDLSPRKVVPIRYDDLVYDAEATCEKLAGKFGIERRPVVFKLPAGKMDTGWETTGETDCPMNLEYYRFKEYLKRFSDEDVEWVSGQVDSQLAMSMGYSECGFADP